MILALSFWLVAFPQNQWPDPYIGYGQGLTATSLYGGSAGAVTRSKSLKPYLSFGFPMRLGHFDESPLVIRLTPEISWSPTLILGNLLIGLEGETPGAYRNILSAYIWGAQVGLHTGGVTDPSSPVDRNGNTIASSDLLSFASMVSLYAGPQFYVSPHVNLRLLINPRVLAGQLAPRTFGMESNPWLGFQMNINLQFEIGAWAEETYSNFRK